MSTLPNPNPIPNDAQISYNYAVDPSLPLQSGSNISNIATTQVNEVNMSSVKTVSAAYADIGTTLTYTIVLTNTGNSTANNFLLTDTTPNGTTFVPGTITVNGTPTTGSPDTGIGIGAINPGGKTTVRYDVIVVTLPVPNPIPNAATGTYVFTLDPNVPNGQSGSTNTNTVTTRVNHPQFNPGSDLVKTVNLVYAKIGDTLNYTIVIRNSGTTTANNVIFADTIPTGTNFVNNSVLINGASNPGNPAAGITLGALGAGQTTTVFFQVVVFTMPVPNPIPNSGRINYNYVVDPSLGTTANASSNTNIVNTQVNTAIIDNTVGKGLVKGVDKTLATIGDTLTYTVTMRNTGNVTANNVVFTDTIPGGTAFIPGTVRINNVLNPANPATGVPVGTIGVGGVATVSFQVMVTTLPTVNPVPNSGTLNFTYTVDPSAPNGQTGGGNTNTVNTQINAAIIDYKTGGGYVKDVSETIGAVGDTITYTLAMRNTGNVAATNVIFRDTIPSGTTFIPGTVRINNGLTSGNPQTGIAIGTIPAGGVTTVSFDVLVGGTIPTPNPIPNTGTTTFTYTVDPSVPNGKSSAGTSNTVNTLINSAVIDNKNGSGLTKSVDKANSKIGDTLAYTITIKNTGNVTATNVVFSDTIPNGTSFIPSTLFVNGVPNVNNPQNGVNVGSIAPGATVLVTFNVLVTTFPNPNPIPNNGTVTYNYVIDPSLPSRSGGGNTNTTTTQVNQAIISSVKSADKVNAKLGDTITYTVNMTNQGNVTAESVTFFDTVPDSTTFIPNTVTINGGANPGNPAVGINVGNVGPNQVVAVAFKVTVTSIPASGVALNTSTANYNFTLDPNNPGGASGASTSNQTTTNLNQASIDFTTGGMTKTVDKAYADIGDTLVYTVTLRNTGNTTASTVVFSDTIPSGTTFVAGSVRINGVQNTGNPQAGISVGNIGPNQTTVVLFRVIVNTLPTPNPIPNNSTVNYTYIADPSLAPVAAGGNSNTVNTQVNNASMNYNNGQGLVKAADKAYVAVGDTINYTITLKNTGNVTATSINFFDTIPNGTTFVAGSLRVNGVPNSGNPGAGVSIGSLAPFTTMVVLFSVLVTTIPVPNPIPNQAVLNYAYTVDPSFPNGKTGTGISNVVTSQLNQPGIDDSTGGFTKTPSKSYADIGDTITYTMVLKNTGNVSANNVVVRDTIPNGTSFINNSVFVNNTPNASNPQTGINIGTLAPNQVATVLFSIKVNTIPNPNPIKNQANIAYTYTKDPSVPNGANGEGKSNVTNTTISHAEIASGSGGLVKSADATTLAVGDTVAYTSTLRNTGNTTANNVFFQDTIPVGMAFVPNSLAFNGLIQTGLNPQTGVNVGNIAPGAGITVTFITTVTSIPAVNPIPNQSQVGYTYTVDPSIPNGGSGSNLSNIVNIQINSAIIDNKSGGLVKSVDKAYGDLGDTLTYTILVKNTGNIPAENVVLYDTIPAGTSLIQNTVTVNGTQQPGANPQTGISLNAIPVNTTISVTFQVKVNSTTIPAQNPVPNNSIITYSFNKC